MGYTHEKSNCPAYMSNTFMPLLALSTTSLPSMQTTTKEDEVGMLGGLDRELSTCLTTSYKQLINSRQSGIFTTRVTGLGHAICYLFKKLKLFLHQLNSKNNGPVLLFKTILALILFPVVCCNGLQGLKMD